MELPNRKRPKVNYLLQLRRISQRHLPAKLLSPPKKEKYLLQLSRRRQEKKKSLQEAKTCLPRSCLPRRRLLRRRLLRSRLLRRHLLKNQLLKRRPLKTPLLEVILLRSLLLQRRRTQARKLLIKFLPPRCLLRKTCPLNRNRLLNRSHLLRNISFHEKRFPQSLPPLLRPPVHLLRPSPREIGLLLRRRSPLLRRGRLPRTSPQAKKFSRETIISR